MKIERFEMERTQCLYENVVELNLSESGVLPLRVEELVESPAERQQLLEQRLWYCESDGSRTLRERIAQFYPDCAAANITITNGGSEANYVSLWALLGDQGRLACMLPCEVGVERVDRRLLVRRARQLGQRGDLAQRQLRMLAGERLQDAQAALERGDEFGFGVFRHAKQRDYSV